MTNRRKRPRTPILLANVRGGTLFTSTSNVSNNPLYEASSPNDWVLDFSR